MAIIKCKMCGGDIEFVSGATYGTCEYCGSVSTIPQAEDEGKLNRYNRANHLRRQCEFDKALNAYEKLLEQDETDAEAHWGAVLSRFGIEYVEDPATKKRIPTCHRVQLTSILADADYKAAVEHAPDNESRHLYEEQAAQIAEIQKGILAVSANEKPYDVFICYKETDESGQRTRDSQWAQDVYYGLTEQGYKVFFSRITLEDKLGRQYEPYIFAALNSAKVMVVIGSKPEYYNAVWVKNEWSRYLALMANDRKRLLIPCYRDMDPYDLPEELSTLQSQDMGKIGFMQDLIRGIKKVLDVPAAEPVAAPAAAVPVAVPVAAPTGGTTESLLKRVFMFLEDGDWNSAEEYSEKVLDIDPENARAYLGKLMASKYVRYQSDLKDLNEPFDNDINYQKVLRFGDTALVNELKGYIAHINERNENARLEGIYQNAVAMMSSKVYDTEHAHLRAADIFGSINAYKDASARRDECLAKAEKARKDGIYDSARRKMRGDVIADYEAAIKLFKSIPGWKDAEAQIADCKNIIQTLREKQEAERLKREHEKALVAAYQEAATRKRKKITTIAAIVCSIAVAVICLFNFVIIPNQKYDAAIELMNNGKYADAYDSFIDLDGYKDSAAKANAIRNKAIAERLTKASVGSYVKFGSYEQDNHTSNGKEDIEWLVLAKENNRLLVISRYALDTKPYNEKYTDVTWETCTLRKWLNNDFLNAAFSSTEKAMIPTVTVSADKNPDYSTNPGNAAQDKVFLLSIPEANKYFASDSARQCKPTAYAKKQGAWTNDSGFCWWWLRSPGYDQHIAAHVDGGGGVSVYGYGVGSGYGAVRPALWIELNP